LNRTDIIGAICDRYKLMLGLDKNSHGLNFYVSEFHFCGFDTSVIAFRINLYELSIERFQLYFLPFTSLIRKIICLSICSANNVANGCYIVISACHFRMNWSMFLKVSKKKICHFLNKFLKAVSTHFSWCLIEIIWTAVKLSTDEATEGDAVNGLKLFLFLWRGER